MAYSIVSGDNGSTITVFEGGQVLVADSSHPNYQAIVEHAIAGKDVADLMDATATVVEKFKRISERVTLSNGSLFFDGEKVENVLTDQVLSFMSDGLDFAPLVNFWEKISQNPKKHSRKQAYRWLAAHNFTIDSEGFILAYKGVVNNGDGTYLSIHSGPAVVDGVAVNGQVPQQVGSLVEMDRSKVTFDPSVGCSSGLHAGTWDYASSFAQGAVLTVRINPRDIVSVPTDCADAKMRVSRYSVVGITDIELPRLFDYEDDEEWDDSDDDNLEEWEDEALEDEGQVQHSFDYSVTPTTFSVTDTDDTVVVNGNSPEELSKRAKKQKRFKGMFSKKGK